MTARHRKKSFVGGSIEETLLRATRITALPRDVVMERKMFKAEKTSSIPAGGALSIWFSPSAQFPSPVLLAIKKMNLAVKNGFG